MNKNSLAFKLRIFLLLPILFSCSSSTSEYNQDFPTTMKAIITNKFFYEDIPSASGIEVIGDSIYIIGDDSPYLYQLNRDFKQTSKLALADTSGFKSGRVAKSEKMDLESMASYERNGKNYLLILGSGASDARMKGFVIEADKVTGKLGKPKSYTLDKLYQQLQDNKEVVKNDQLNIEGLTVESGNVYLMHRAVKQAPNILLEYNAEAFFSALEMNGDVPEPEVHHFKLEKLEGYQAGFSGADIFDGKLFFTASVEQTEDAIADGEVLGSYVGVIYLADLDSNSRKPVASKSALLVYKNNKPYKGKAESLVVSKDKDKYKVLVVSDDDKGHSELLEVELVIK